jgi:hypothetical protein
VRDEDALSELDGTLLGFVTVVPNGVGDTPGELAGRGVAVAGRGVGRAVGLTVGTGVGTGVGGGVGEVTTTGVAKDWLGLLPALVTELKVTVQVPPARVEEPVQVPVSDVPPADNDRGTVWFAEPVDANALTLIAVSAALPR